jgi:hypothetical protein
MRRTPQYRGSHSVAGPRRNGRVWLAVAIATALVVAANLTLVTLTKDVPNLDPRFGILIYLATNGVLAFVCLAGAWIVRRVSARASVVPYVIVSILLVPVAIVADFIMIFMIAAEGSGIIEIPRRMIPEPPRSWELPRPRRLAG